MRFILGLAAFVMSLGILGSPSADGSLPPLPYHYLNPPPSLRQGNLAPLSGSRTVSITFLRHGPVAAATRDGQADVVLPQDSLLLPPGSTSVRIRVTPVQTPPNLPGPWVVDGNAYLLSAAALPSGQPPTLRKKASITLRWPHIPTGLWGYYGASWHRVCYSETFTLTTSTVGCPISSLGTYAAVTLPSTVPLPRATQTSSRLLSYLPFIVAAVVVIVAAVGAFFIARRTRPNARGRGARRSPGDGTRGSGRRRR